MVFSGRAILSKHSVTTTLPESIARSRIPGLRQQHVALCSNGACDMFFISGGVYPVVVNVFLLFCQVSIKVDFTKSVLDL